MKSKYIAMLFLALASLLVVIPSHATDSANASTNERYLIDLVDIQGLRENQLIGYGLVVGLDGTGDRNQVKFTSQSVTNMLRQFGLQLDDKIDPKLRNVAAVSVHASIPPLTGKGQTIDITVSSIGDAKSLRGGSLLMTPMRAIDGQVYAVAQGNLVVGGIKAEGARVLVSLSTCRPVVESRQGRLLSVKSPQILPPNP